MTGARTLTVDGLSYLPHRANDAHKYEAGTVLVIGSSRRYLGASELSARGALRAGAGLVTIAGEERLAGGWPEIIHAPLPGGGEFEALLAIEERHAQVVVAGPGLDEDMAARLPELLERWQQPWVLDAGALRAEPEMRAAVARHGGCVLTPHAGEAGRLLGVSAAGVTDDPLAAATRLARDWNAVAVLKGSSTVIASTGGSLAVSPFGHPGMATGGTGDVLAGVLGALLAAPGSAGMTARVETGVVLHGLAGRMAGEELGISLVASDVVAKLPAALGQLFASGRC